MLPKTNPQKLNALQLKTLTILQELARHPESCQPDPATGGALVTSFPQPHGDHFHLAGYLVMAADITGLRNQAVWTALERKGLAVSRWPLAIVLTEAGIAYPTGLREKILHGSDH